MSVARIESKGYFGLSYNDVLTKEQSSKKGRGRRQNIEKKKDGKGIGGERNHRRLVCQPQPTTEIRNHNNVTSFPPSFQSPSDEASSSFCERLR
ncbi:hypothetical protein HZH68_008907 [Vespula germanica]|uniref:Uncharacterized protein n=1 Tax=Vespula germanica TaxID=30212 RepID=A0A834N6M6_VESGE|nr:hypothetical protein HZH68_008907 [Vespula germanica]